MEIYLIGTDYWDLNGEKRLERKLYEIAPDFILVEGSEEAENNIKVSHSVFERELEKIIPFKDCRDLLIKSRKAVGHEYRATREYSLKNSIGLEYFNDVYPRLDLNNEIKTAKKNAESFKGVRYNEVALKFRLNQIDQDRSWENVKKWLDTDEENEFSNNGIYHVKEDGIGERDRIMELKIRNKVRDGNLNRLACVTGFVHVLNDFQNRTIYSKIRDLNPKGLPQNKLINL